MRQPGNYSTDDRRNSKIDLYIYALQIINSMKEKPAIQQSLKNILKDTVPVFEVKITFPLLLSSSSSLMTRTFLALFTSSYTIQHHKTLAKSFP